MNTTDAMKMQDVRLNERKRTVGLQVSKNKNLKIPFFISLVFRQRLSTEEIPVSLTIQVASLVTATVSPHNIPTPAWALISIP